MDFTKACLIDPSERNSNFDVVENCLFIKVNSVVKKNKKQTEYNLDRVRTDVVYDCSYRREHTAAMCQTLLICTLPKWDRVYIPLGYAIHSSPNKLCQISRIL